MNRVTGHNFPAGIIICLMVVPSLGSLLYTKLHIYPRWITTSTSDRWSLLARWYPWIDMADYGTSLGRGSCPENETYAQFGVPCGKSCGTYGQLCPIVRLNRCVCVEGHVRNRQGKCIHYTDCTKTLEDVEILH